MIGGHLVLEIACPLCGETHALVLIPCDETMVAFLNDERATHWAVCPLLAEVIWVGIPEQPEVDRSYIIIRNCSSCGGIHMIKTHELEEPVRLDGDLYSHYALCPLTDETLLVIYDES